MNYHLTLYKPKKPGQFNYFDQVIISNRLEKSEQKINKSMENILLNISKLKKGRSKKYQISGYYEWKKLKQELILLSDIQFNLSTSETLTKNVVNFIVHGYYSGCCSECDTSPIYIHKKVPVLFIYVKKL